MPSYIHHTPGRLRVRSQVIKRDEAAAGRARDILTAHPGIEGVETNPTTGSITIRYAASHMDGSRVLALLDGHGFLRPKAVPGGAGGGAVRGGAPVTDRLAEKVGSAIGTVLLEKLLERSATVLIAALI